MADLFSNILSEPRHWANHAANQTTVLGLVGGAVGADAPACKVSILSMAQHLPVVMAMSLSTDLLHAYVTHSPTLIPADPTNTTRFNDNVLALIGDNLATALPVVLPQDAFGRCAAAYALRTPLMTGDPGFASTVPQVQFGPYTATDPDVDCIHAQRVFVLPPSQVSAAMTSKDPGCYTNQDFYNTFLVLDLSSGDAVKVRDAGPLSDWFRLHFTKNASNDGLLQVDAADGGSPGEQQVLLRSIPRLRESLKTLLSTSGPSVTNANFNAGISRITAQMQINATDHVTYLKQANLKTFTEKHGPHLATCMHIWHQVSDDIDLPAVHTLMAKSQKSCDYGILQAAIDACVGARTMPLSVMRAPMATTKLTNEVFRCFNPVSERHTFGEGLSPFTCLCKGHKKAQEVHQAVRKAKNVEGRSTVSLHDASSIITTNVRFADTIQVASEKCYGFSILVDLFHGDTANIAQFTHAAMIKIVPLLSPMVDTLGGLPIGMDYVNRILFAIQVEYTCYLKEILTSHGSTVAPAYKWI